MTKGISVNVMSPVYLQSCTIKCRILLYHETGSLSPILSDDFISKEWHSGF